MFFFTVPAACDTHPVGLASNYFCFAVHSLYLFVSFCCRVIFAVCAAINLYPCFLGVFLLWSNTCSVCSLPFCMHPFLKSYCFLRKLFLALFCFFGLLFSLSSSRFTRFLCLAVFLILYSLHSLFTQANMEPIPEQHMIIGLEQKQVVLAACFWLAEWFPRSFVHLASILVISGE